MPNYLRLQDKQTGESHEGRGLIAVDEKLCQALGVPVDDVKFYRGWVDWVCLYLNDDWAGVRKMESETSFDPDYYQERKVILDWLEDNYHLGTYATIGRGRA